MTNQQTATAVCPALVLGFVCVVCILGLGDLLIFRSAGSSRDREAVFARVLLLCREKHGTLRCSPEWSMRSGLHGEASKDNPTMQVTAWKPAI